MTTTDLIYVDRAERRIKDQRMHRLFIDFDKDGNITNISESLFINCRGELEPDRPCDRLIEFIAALYNKHPIS